MGRQSARLWHDGKDHKDLWKLIDDNENYSGKSWRMHWQIYKGNKLLWEKLPQNYLVACRGNSYLVYNFFESVCGEKFTDCGFLKNYTNSPTFTNDICFVGKYMFAHDASHILCTNNFYSWKKLAIEFNLINNEKILYTTSYNEKLLIITDHKIITYNIAKNEINYIYDGRNKNGDFYFKNVGCEHVYSSGDTLIIGCREYSSSIGGSTTRHLLIIKRDVLVKTFSDTSGWSYMSVSGNQDTVYTYRYYAENRRINLVLSKDGLVWERLGIKGLDYLFCVKNALYSFIRHGSWYTDIYKFENDSWNPIKNKVNVTTFKGGKRLLAFESKDYMYGNAVVEVDGTSKVCFIRFKDFESEEYEILIEGEVVEGIYIEKWED